MRVYLATFLLVTVGTGLLARAVTIYPMAWWPDTVLFGLPFGIVAALAAWNERHTHRFFWNALKGVIHRRRKASRL